MLDGGKNNLWVVYAHSHCGWDEELEAAGGSGCKGGWENLVLPSRVGPVGTPDSGPWE